MAMRSGATVEVSPVATRPDSSRIHQEGIVAGVIGAATVAVWFLLLDTLAGRPLSTPTLLGAALFRRGAVVAGLSAHVLPGGRGRGRPGWTVGGGAEYAFAPRWSIKVEYLYYDLGTMSTLTSDELGRFPGQFQTFTTDVTGNVVRLGVNFKF